MFSLLGLNLKEPKEDVIYDLIIIGGGPAGITAAIYSARKNLNLLILTKDLGGQILLTSEIENYPGFQYITSKELAEKFTNQLSLFPISLGLGVEVNKLKKEDNIFLVKTIDNKVYKSKTVIIATGRSPKPLNLPNEKELLGKGVSYCATCDAPLFKNKNTAVIGGGNSAVISAIELAKICQKVYLIVRSEIKADYILKERLKNFNNVNILLKHLPKAILGKEKVNGLLVYDQLNNKEYEISLDGVFIEAGMKPNTEFLKGFLELNEKDEIIINCNCETNVPGVFACGDCTSVEEKQIVIACGEGAKASLKAFKYLLSL
ncbi:MAG: FAD-dependent oxidoreductase [candidate division WOR-3 bacterium]|nr:FAD-dependent oxidoreductase [candidate division WOR-3 bacterium]MCX7836963.1 FAD-dependent oxidoreductase [candidate division WOR-3 bacterium]MDW8114091.1 FAD-dependent oxidoreductase [candidate division WOR-3 bacterium]